MNVLKATRDTGIERVLLASSSSVYGKPEFLRFDESLPTTSVSPCGVSKLAAERCACAYSEVCDLRTFALRYLMMFGPRMRPNMAISNFVSRCINDKPPVIYGDGRQTRDFIFIKDVVKANVTLLSEDAADAEAVNIGSTDNIEILTLAKEIRDQLAPSLEIEFAERHDADAEHTHADSSKAAELLDYEPNRTIREGVAEFVEWYRANREWYEPLVLES